MIELINELIPFQISNSSRLKPNKTKCEIAGGGVLNGVQVALCCMKCVYLDNETVKLFGADFSYNKILSKIKKFCELIVKTENILKSWRMRQLTLEGRIQILSSF